MEIAVISCGLHFWLQIVFAHLVLSSYSLSPYLDTQEVIGKNIRSTVLSLADLLVMVMDKAQTQDRTNYLRPADC